MHSQVSASFQLSSAYSFPIAFYASDILTMFYFFENVKHSVTLGLLCILLPFFQNNTPPSFLHPFHTQTFCVIKVYPLFVCLSVFVFQKGLSLEKEIDD